MERREEILNDCLSAFVEKGYARTTIRDLAEYVGLPKPGLYYWFSSKEDIVLSCLEEALRRIEIELLQNFFGKVDTAEEGLALLKEQADKMAPTVRFFISACLDVQYKDETNKMVSKMADIQSRFIDKIANEIGCPPSEIAPKVYLMISSLSDYMIYGNTKYVKPQVEIAAEEFMKVKNKYKKQK